MKKLALSVLLVLIAFGVGGTAWADDTVILGAAFNNNSNIGHANAMQLKNVAGSATIDTTGDLLTITVNSANKLNAAGWADLRKAIDDWSDDNAGVTFKIKFDGDGQADVPANIFNGVTCITEIELATPALTTINPGAFEGMTALTSFEMAAGAPITAIPDNMLKGAIVLRYIGLSSNIERIGARAFSGTAIGEFKADDQIRLDTIGEGAFADCLKLATVNLDAANRFKTIGDNAFSGCVKLETFVLPGEVVPAATPPTIALETIGAGAFKGCEKLLKGNGLGLANALRLTTIGASAFEGCKEMTWVAFPGPTGSKLSVMGNRAFYGDAKLSGLGSWTWTQTGIDPNTGIPVQGWVWSQGGMYDAVFTVWGSEVFTGTDLTQTLNVNFSDSLTTLGTNAFGKMSVRAVFKADTTEQPFGTAAELAAYLAKINMPKAFRGANQAPGSLRISIGDVFFQEGTLLRDLGLLIEPSATDTNTVSIVKSLYNAGITPASIVWLFDITQGGSWISNPSGGSSASSYPLTIELVEKIVHDQGLETGSGETPGGQTPGGQTPGGETPGGETPGGSSEETSSGSGGGCDAGFGLLGALIVLGAVKFRGRKAA
jgi:hypothetical protein